MSLDRKALGDSSEVTGDTPFATRALLEAALARHWFCQIIEVAPDLTTAGDPQQAASPAPGLGRTPWCRPLLYCPVNDEGPFEATRPTFFNRTGLKDTLASVGFAVRSLESLWPPTPGWRFLLRYLLRRRLLGRRRPGRPDPLPYNRVVALCSAIPRDPASFVDRYWQGTHRYHTRVDQAPR